jgi:hypothetical protein
MEAAKAFLRVSGRFIVFFVALGLAVVPAWAQTTVSANWVDSTGNWTTPSNWSCTCVPNNSPANVFNVTILAGAVSLDNTSSLASATINTLSLAAPLEINNGESMNVTGNADATPQGALNVASYGLGTSSPGLSVGGNFTGYATLGAPPIQGGTMSVAGAFIGGAYLYRDSALQVSSFTNTTDTPYTWDYGGTITVSGDLTNENGQVLSIAPSGGYNGNQGTLNVGGNLRNSGIVALGSTLTVSGNLINTATGDMEIYSISSASVMGGTSNSGKMTLAGAGGALDELPAVMTSGDFSNAGMLNLESGSVNSGGAYTQTAGSTNVDGTLMAPSVIISGGMLSGSGMIRGNIINAATVVPSTVVPSSCSPATPTTLTIHGNYTQDSDGTLVIDIASATDFSMLDIIGAASLGGTVDFEFLNGYVPAPNSEFTFLEASSITGGFRTFDFTNGSCPTCSFQMRTTPEPGSLILFGTALLGLAALLLRKRTLRETAGFI